MRINGKKEIRNKKEVEMCFNYQNYYIEIIKQLYLLCLRKLKLNFNSKL